MESVPALVIDLLVLALLLYRQVQVRRLADGRISVILIVIGLVELAVPRPHAGRTAAGAAGPCHYRASRQPGGGWRQRPVSRYETLTDPGQSGSHGERARKLTVRHEYTGEGFSLLRLPDGSEPRDAGIREGRGIRRAAERADAPFPPAGSRARFTRSGSADKDYLISAASTSLCRSRAGIADGARPGLAAIPGFAGSPGLAATAGLAGAGFAPIVVPALMAGLAITRGRIPVPGRLVTAGIRCGA